MPHAARERPVSWHVVQSAKEHRPQHGRAEWSRPVPERFGELGNLCLCLCRPSACDEFRPIVEVVTRVPRKRLVSALSIQQDDRAMLARKPHELKPDQGVHRMDGFIMVMENARQAAPEVSRATLPRYDGCT